MKDPLDLSKEESIANREREIERTYQRLWFNGCNDSMEVRISLLAYLQILLYFNFKEICDK